MLLWRLYGGTMTRIRVRWYVCINNLFLWLECCFMYDHKKNIEDLEKLINKIGIDEFKIALKYIYERIDKKNKENCNHKWTLLQIAGDGYKCYLCGSYKDED